MTVDTDPADSDALVFFGATGDLARKEVWPALFELHEQGRLGVPVVGVAADTLDDDGLRALARQAITDYGHGISDEGRFADFAAHVRYVGGDFGEPATFAALARRLDAARPLHYLAIPPALFETAVEGLAGEGLHDHARLVVEKPFGHDRASAAALNRALQRRFPEEAILRIDHFLGLESVENLMVTRFANTLFEPVWNRRFVDRVELTMAEEFGVEDRGRFYDTTGALVDVVQSHLLQLVALLAMEPPVSAEADALRDEKVKVLRAIRGLDPGEVVRGQYLGYRDHDGVAHDSDTETYVAFRLHVDSWRWAGVPFLLRTGKRLPVTATEASVALQPPPRPLFADPACPDPHPNTVRFAIGGDGGIRVGIMEKAPGGALVTRPGELALTHPETGPALPYAGLLADALAGDTRRFARQDGIEEAWRIVEPVLSDPPPAIPYEPGTWGPPAADRLVDPAGGR